MGALKGRLAALGCLAALSAMLAAATVSFGAPGDAIRVSVSSANVEGNNDSLDASISADGRYVVFASRASSLVAADTNTFQDIYLRDTASGTTTLVSVSSAPGNVQGNADSRNPVISADGSAVAFESLASNLVSGDSNGTWDVFVRDLSTGSTTRANKTQAGGEPNFGSFSPDLSASGRFVVYHTQANNIVPSDLNAATDVFLYDRIADTTERISLTTAGTPGGFGEEAEKPVVSADGRFVAFQVTRPYSGPPGFDPGDTNTHYDIYVRDRIANTTTRVSRSTSGGATDGDSINPAVSGDGEWIAFQSTATNVVSGDTNGDVDVFVVNRATVVAERVSVSSAEGQAIGSSGAPSLNYDGDLVAFESTAENLVAGDSNTARDVFARHRIEGKTTRESTSSSGTQLNGSTGFPALSADGVFVAFHSSANNVVEGDTNNRPDVFRHELGIKDETPPVVTGTADRAANADGWYSADVTIDWVATDPGLSSGPPTDPPDTVASTEGRNTAFTSEPSCDPANNCATGTLTLSIDKTEPAISSAASPPNTNGWYRDDVVVAFACSDALSGISSCSGPVTIATEGAAGTATGSAVDRAGNSTSLSHGPIRLDKTPPAITFTGGGSYSLDDIVSITCTATDALSGIAETSCPDVNGPAYLFPVGANTVIGTATDKAGNTASGSTSFTVAIGSASIGRVACLWAGDTGHGRAVCRKLSDRAAEAEAADGRGATKARDKAIREFQMTASKESGRLFTADQVAVLSRMISTFAA